jgi:4'-phosphopantetheinyl transferase
LNTEPLERDNDTEIVDAGRLALDGLLARPAAFALLAPGETAVWRIRHPAPLPVPACFEACLDDAERRRAARFHHDRDRRLFLLSHGALRHILAAHAGIPPAAVVYTVSDRGKPGLSGQGPAFNLSHAGECVLVAVSAAGPVGVDVEPVRALPDAAGLVARFFAAEEREAYLRCPEADRTEAFHLVWTRKEAYVKALGGGLSIPFDAFAVSLDRPARLLRPFRDAPTPGPRLSDIPVPPGYAGALAGRARRILCRELTL